MNESLTSYNSLRNSMPSKIGQSIATRQPAIPQAQDSLDKSLAVLSEKMFALESRLASVIRQSPCEIKEPNVNPPASTVYEKINNSADEVSDLIVRIESLIQSLEV